MLLLDACHVAGVGATRWMPGVTELARTPDRTRRGAAHPDLRALRRTRLGCRVVEGPVFAVEVPLAVPERAHQPDRLVGAAATALELDTHEVELVLVPAHPDSEGQASSGKLLDGRDLLRELHRVVERHEHDRRAEADPLGPARDPAEGDERRVHAAVRVNRLRADDDVLRRPDGVEAQLLGRLSDAADAVDRRAFAIVGQDHAEVHDPRLTAARVARLATTDPDGRPHLVPIVFVLEGDTLYSAVDRKPKRSATLRRVENARVRPDLTI